jgi:uncharacterized protein YigA (DUF484 family)
VLLTHDHYKELCSLAASGQGSSSELNELREHLHACAECSSLLGELGQLVAQGLPTIADEVTRVTVPLGMTQRFVARARSEGFVLSVLPDSKSLNSQGGKEGSLARRVFFSFAAAAVILLALWELGIKAVPHGSPERRNTNQTNASNQPTPDIPVDSKDLLARIGDLNRRLQGIQAERDRLTEKIKADESALEFSKRERFELSSRLSVRDNDAAEFLRTQADNHARIARLKDELDALQSESEASRVAAAVEETELNRLRETVERQAEELKEKEQLASAANRAKDLIVARNLHIVDVHDADESGKRQRAFGRIFYTEGQSLVFYAYDLKGPAKLDAKIAFHVWGERLGTGQAVKSLGIFHSDSESDGRWILTFDDPRVLAQINTVFVTVESGKKSITQPSGKKILYAFLGQANHP